MMLRLWAFRLTILVAISGAVAAADALVVRPMPKSERAPQEQASSPDATGTTAQDSAPSTNAVLLEDVRALYESGEGFFVDARPLNQFVEAHIPGAFHVDVDAFRRGRPAALEFLPTDAEIVIYCGGGDCDASHMVERMMISHGYTKLRIFEQGFPAWQSAGLDIEQGEPPVQ